MHVQPPVPAQLAGALVMQYSVDVDDGHATISVPIGGQATSPEVARGEAVRLLTEMVKAKIVGGDEHLLVSVVKDNANRAIYRVLLTMICTKLG